MIFLLGLSEATFAQTLGDTYRLPGLEQGLVAIDLSSTLPKDRLAIIGEKAIVASDALSAPPYPRGARESGQRLLVIRRPNDGALGITDGSILLSLREADDLASVVSDHGLEIDRIFSTESIALLKPIGAKQIPGTVDRLISDARVLSAELNSNYQSFSAN